MKRVNVLVVVLALAAIVPTFALAKPMSGTTPGNAQANDPQYLLGPGEIPYLSHGIGVNEANFRGSASQTQKRVVIPYLSHGVGVTSAELSGVAADDRSFARETTPWPAPVVKTDDGWSIDSGNSAMVAFAVVLGLLAGAAGMAVWRSRRLSPA